MSQGFGPAFDAAQRACDAREPEPDCDEGHEWRCVKSDEEGNQLWRCRRCGKEEVS